MKNSKYFPIVRLHILFNDQKKNKKQTINLTKGEQNILFALAGYASTETLIAKASYTTLMGYTGMTKKGVNQVIKSLETKGYITIKRSGKLTNQYYISIFELVDNLRPVVTSGNHAGYLRLPPSNLPVVTSGNLYYISNDHTNNKKDIFVDNNINIKTEDLCRHKAKGRECNFKGCDNSKFKSADNGNILIVLSKSYNQFRSVRHHK